MRKNWLETKPDVIIDAIDSLIPKAHLIASCYRSKQPLVTCGGAGGRVNPAKIEIGDLSRTKGDPPALQPALQAQKRLRPTAGGKSPETENPLRLLPGNSRLPHLRRRNLLHARPGIPGENGL